jgi:hypothetical protein
MTTKPKAFRLTNAYYCKPLNGEGGLYVEVEADYARVQERGAATFAESVAADFGFDARGRATTGIPWRYSAGVCRRAFWFHDIFGKPAGIARGSDAVIHAATSGPKCVYEHRSEDPRRR